MQEPVSIALSVAAVVAAVIILFYGLRRRAQLTTDLRPLIDALTEARAVLAGTSLPEQFKQQLPEIGSRMRSLPVVGSAWMEYSMTLVLDPQLDVVVASRPASEYFNAKLPYHPEVGLRAHDSTPNQLVGMGLFFTFVGLFLSLVIASGGMSGDINQAKESLISLLSASAVKFLTSIAAILAALLFTHRKHKLLALVDAELAGLRAELDRLTASTSAEALATQSLQQQRRHTELLENSNQDLARTIAAEMNATLQIGLKEAIAPVAEEINGMAARLGEINETAMRYMVDRFTKELGGAAREHSQQMAGLLDQVARAVQGVPEAIDGATGRFTAAIDNALGKVETTFRGADSRLVSALDSATTGITDSANSLRSVCDQLAALSTELASAGTGIGDRLTKFDSATAQTSESLEEIVKRLRKMAEHLPNLDGFAAQVASAAKAVEASAKAAEKLQAQSLAAERDAADNFTRLADAAKEFRTGTSDLDEALSKVLAQLTEGLDSFAGRTTGVLSNMDQGFADTVERLNSVVTSMTAAVGRLDEAGRRIAVRPGPLTGSAATEQQAAE